MKNIEKYLNDLQIRHLHDPTKCTSKKCKFQNCVVCTCGMRSDAEYCCPNHRSAENNIISNKRNAEINYYHKLHKKNSLIIHDLLRRGIILFEHKDLVITGYDFTFQPIIVKMEDGKEASAFGNIIMWIDEKDFYHLRKIN